MALAEPARQLPTPKERGVDHNSPALSITWLGRSAVFRQTNTATKLAQPLGVLERVASEGGDGG